MSEAEPESMYERWRRRERERDRMRDEGVRIFGGTGDGSWSNPVGPQMESTAAEARRMLEVYGVDASENLSFVEALNRLAKRPDLARAAQLVGQAFSGSLAAYVDIESEHGITASDLGDAGASLPLNLTTYDGIQDAKQALVKAVGQKVAS